MEQYRLTVLFGFISSVIIGIAIFIIIRSTGNLATIITTSGLFTGLVVFILGADVVISRSNRRQRERDVEAARLAYLQESRRRIVAAQEGVRKEIALRLHGSVQNRLILLMHRLHELEQAVSPELARELSDLQRDFGEVLQKDIRAITRELYPSILRHGLVPALQSLGDSFEDTLTIAVEPGEEFSRQDREDRRLVPEQVRLAAYRIVEEALGNVVKRAKASRVAIRPELTADGRLRLSVRDNGCGFDLDTTTAGLGMTAMRDYAEAAGGTGLVQITPGLGTEVIATLPVEALQAEHSPRASSSG